MGGFYMDRRRMMRRPSESKQEVKKDTACDKTVDLTQAEQIEVLREENENLKRRIVALEGK